ncbi:MAG: IS21 family transposase, partial [Hungatella sp.]
MIDYREIIRLKSAEYSNTSVASSTGSSRNKVADIWDKTQEKQLQWPIPDELTNEDLKAILYPQEAAEQSRFLPDYEYVYNELAKPG